MKIDKGLIYLLVSACIAIEAWTLKEVVGLKERVAVISAKVDRNYYEDAYINRDPRRFTNGMHVAIAKRPKN